MKRKYRTVLAFFRESIWGRYVLPGILLPAFLLIQSPALMALGSGPSSPEALNFSPLQPDNLVNTFTGDLNYSIPILDIGGYPIGLTYNSNHTVEEEASWVGLGWNLNIGTIERQMKGIPDDFNGDKIIQENNMKPNISGSLILNGISGELIGFEKTLLSLTIGYNNYNGFMYNFGMAPDNNNNGSSGSNPDNGNNTTSPATQNTSHAFSAPFGINIGSGGITLSPTLSLDAAKHLKKLKFLGLGLDFNVNSYTGIQTNAFFNITKKSEKNTNNSKTGNRILGMGFSYSPISFSPSSPLSYRNYSFGLTVKPAGLETIFATASSGIGGQFSMQKLAQKIQYLPCTGFLYMKNKVGVENTLTDINTEKEVTYVPGLPHVPITYMEPDLFNVNVEGISGTYRAYKNTGMVVNHIKQVASKGADGDLDLEIGGGNLVKFGNNISFGSSQSSYGSWLINNQLVLYGKNTNFYNGFTNCYFKKSGEPSVSISSSYYHDIGEEHPFAYKVKTSTANPFMYSLTTNSMTGQGNGISLINREKYPQQYLPKQTTAFVPIRKADLQHHPYFNNWYKPYMNNDIRPHHIAQIQVVGENGTKYVFGCPAYNYVQKEVSFNVAKTSGTSKYVEYNPNDASLNNEQGLSHYYQSKTIPPYAYAYNITEVYSADYSDLTGNGPTVDDYGNYIIFKYNETSKIKKYKWRTPYTKLSYQANYDEGNFSLDDDNTANYVYGEKDIWYIDTIRTKDQIAVFYKSPRKDAYEAGSEHGGVGGRSMMRLDSIKLWNLQDFKHLGVNAPVLKKAVFKYDYSLCKGVPNNIINGGGKLTLTDVEITEGVSLENQRSAYHFEYGQMPGGTTVVNKNYNPNNMDRWGFYQQADSLNHLYPYTNQDQPADLMKNAYNWNLTTIELPTGAKIKVEYEPDDYRYVQDKKAMRMFKLFGTGGDINSLSITNTLDKNNTVLYFKTDIPSTLSLQEALKEFNKYFDGNNVMKQLYFKAKVNVNRTGVNSYYPNAPKEYIHGFAEISDKKLIQSGSDYYGAIKLNPVTYKLSSYHPFSFAAIQYSMANTNRFFTNQAMLPNDDDISAVASGFFNFGISNILNIVNSAIALLQGPIKNAYFNGMGKYIEATDSWIRLNIRDKKYGGGSRVKKVVYTNEWSNLTGEQGGDVAYIKTYEYITTDSLSSGVASYEPMVGGDEIPHRRIVTYENETGGLLAFTRNLMPVPQYEYFYPIGELQYPGPSVGYSRVIEKTIRPGDGTMGNGMTISTFYTAKDYPVETSNTLLFEHTPKLNVPANVLNIYKTHAVVSEGFSIVLNDMVGKPQKVETYDGSGNVIKKMVYHYHQPGEKVPYYTSKDNIEKAYPGLETDVTVFLKEEQSNSLSTKFMNNIDASAIPPLPAIIPVPSVFMSMTSTESVYRLCSVSKVIYQTGVLKSIDIMDRGANVSKNILAHHPIGGGELITSTKDKFGPTYSYQLPGYFTYPQLGAASSNAGLIFTLNTDTTGQIILPSYGLTDGDRLVDVFNYKGYFYWVLSDIAGNLYLIDKNGNKVKNFNSKVWVETSGYRNMFNLPVEQIACKNNPVTGNTVSIGTANRIISGGASTLTDFYSYPCDTCMYKCNPNSYGVDTLLDPSRTEGLVLDGKWGKYKGTLVEAAPGDSTHYYSLIVFEQKKNPVSHRLLLRKHKGNHTLWVKEIIIPKNIPTRLVDWYVNDEGIFVLKEKVSPGGGTTGPPPDHQNAKKQKRRPMLSPSQDKLNKTVQFCDIGKSLNGKELYLARYNLEGQLLLENKISYDVPQSLTGANVKKTVKQAKDIVVFKDSLAYIAGKTVWRTPNFAGEAAYVMAVDMKQGKVSIYFYPEQKEVYELTLQELDLYGIGKVCSSTGTIKKPVNIFKLDKNMQMEWSTYLPLDRGIEKDREDFSNYTGIKLHSIDKKLYMAGLFKPYKGKNQLHVFQFDQQGNLMNNITWQYDKNEQTGIYGIDDVGGILTMTGYNNNEGKYITLDQNWQISTRSTKHYLHDIAVHSLNDLVYTGIPLTNQQQGNYFFTGINGAVIGCTAKKDHLETSVKVLTNSLKSNVIDSLFNVNNADFDESTVNLTGNLLCNSLQASISVKDACDCSASITFNLTGHYSGLTYQWVNLPSNTPVVNTGEGVQSIRNLCPGSYGLIISDTLNQTSYTFIFEIGQMELDTAAQLVVNPFIHQLKNRWRPEKQWVYDTLRVPAQPGTPVILEQQGHFATYDRFWNYNATGNQWVATGTTVPQWLPAEFTTYHDRFGNPSESRDIIGNYSSAYFAYNGTLQEALAYNARSNEIGFDSFEDYYTQINHPATKGHFRLHQLPQTSYITGEENHTGLYALQLLKDQKVAYQTLIKHYLPGNPPPKLTPTVPFKLQPGYCSDIFAPFDSTRTYMLSVWLKANKDGKHLYGESTGKDGFVSVKLNQAPIALKKVYESPEIEGWVQYKYEFDLQAVTCDTLSVELVNNSYPKLMEYYFDDLKIEPKDALMKTYVYHPYRKLLMAELDENNYAVKYFYNNKDELEEVVKETERGDLYMVYKKNRKVQK